MAYFEKLVFLYRSPSQNNWNHIKAKRKESNHLKLSKRLNAFEKIMENGTFDHEEHVNFSILIFFKNLLLQRHPEKPLCIKGLIKVECEMLPKRLSLKNLS